jgi:hypothetical protein
LHPHKFCTTGDSSLANSATFTLVSRGKLEESITRDKHPIISFLCCSVCLFSWLHYEMYITYKYNCPSRIVFLLFASSCVSMTNNNNNSTVYAAIFINLGYTKCFDRNGSSSSVSSYILFNYWISIQLWSKHVVRV